MVWTKLTDTYSDDAAELSDAAFRTHTEALNWTMRRVTAGRITRRDLRRFAECKTADPEKAAEYLADIGWWENHESGDGWQILHDMPYQRTPDQVARDQAANTARQQRFRDNHRNGVTNGVGNGGSNAMRNAPQTSTSTDVQVGSSSKGSPTAEPSSPGRSNGVSNAVTRRDDVDRLCTHLAERVEGNGSKRPNITKAWRDAARLLLDRDGRTEAQVHLAIDWCQNDEFWRANVMSMPKLREQYDQLRLQAARSRGPVDRRQQATDDLFDRAMARAAARDEAEGTE